MVRVATFIQDQDYVLELSDLLERKGQVCVTHDIDVFRFNFSEKDQANGYPVAVVEIFDPNYPLDLLRSISQDSLNTQVIAVDRTFYKKHGKDKVTQACKSAGASHCYFDDGDMEGLVDTIRGILPKKLVVPWIGARGSQSGGYGTSFETNFHKKRYRLRAVEDVCRAGENVEIIRFPLIITEFETPGMLPGTKHSWQGSKGLAIKSRMSIANKETPIVVMGGYSDQRLSNGVTVTETFRDIPNVYHFNKNNGVDGFIELVRQFL